MAQPLSSSNASSSDESSRPAPLYIQIRLPGTHDEVTHFHRRLSRAISPIAKFRVDIQCVRQNQGELFEVYVPRIAQWAFHFASDYRAVADLIAVLSRIVALAHQHALFTGYLRTDNICSLEPTTLLNTPLLQDVRFHPKLLKSYDEDELLKLPPELITRGLRQLGPSNLVYALGNLLYQLVVRHPILDSRREDCVELHTNSNPETLVDLVPNTPISLSRICERALNRKVHWRYQSPDEMAEDLRDFNRGKKLRAHSTHTSRTAHAALKISLSLLTIVVLTTAVGFAIPNVLDFENDFDAGDEMLYED